jgi:hypothetical protein
LIFKPSANLQGTTFFPVLKDVCMKMDFRYTLPKKEDTRILDIIDMLIVKHYGIALSVWRILR